MLDYNIQYYNLLKELNSQKEHIDPKRLNITRKSIPFKSMDIDVSNYVPLLQVKKMFVTSAVKELNMFLGGTMNISKLNASFWDDDAYNYYCRKVSKEIKNGVAISKELFLEVTGRPCAYLKNYNYGDLGKVYGELWDKQLDYIIKQLKDNKYHTDMLCLNTDHRIKNDIHNRALEPCHFAFQIVATPGGIGLVFNMRSSDVFLGLPMNILFYYLLGSYIAEKAGNGLKLTNLYPSLSNVHLYNNSFNAVQEIIDNNSWSGSIYVIPLDFKYIDKKVVFSESITHNEYLKDTKYYKVPMLSQSNELL